MLAIKNKLLLCAHLVITAAIIALSGIVGLTCSFHTLAMTPDALTDAIDCRLVVMGSASILEEIGYAQFLADHKRKSLKPSTVVESADQNKTESARVLPWERIRLTDPIDPAAVDPAAPLADNNLQIFLTFDLGGISYLRLGVPGARHLKFRSLVVGAPSIYLQEKTTFYQLVGLLPVAQLYSGDEVVDKGLAFLQQPNSNMGTASVIFHGNDGSVSAQVRSPVKNLKLRKWRSGIGSLPAPGLSLDSSALGGALGGDLAMSSAQAAQRAEPADIENYFSPSLQPRSFPELVQVPRTAGRVFLMRLTPFDPESGRGEIALFLTSPKSGNIINIYVRSR